MLLKVSIKGFTAIRPIARKTTCRVRIVSKKGIPFLLNRYRKRKAFALGALLFVALLYVMSSFVWVIEVNGNKRIDNSTIIKNLGDMGIKTGTFKFGIDTESVVNNLMLKNADLAWVEVEIKGTKVKVDVAERILRPELVPLDKPCDIIADKDGFISKVVAKEGQEAVKAGDTVTKGQLLISGTVVSSNEEKTTILVHALGEVYARTWYEDNAPVETVIEEKILTGKTKSNFTLDLMGKKIKIPFRKVKFGFYDSKQTENNLSLGNDFVFPFGIIIDKYSEYKIVKRELSQDEARELAMDKLYEKVSERLPDDVEIVNTKKDFVEGQDGLMLAKVSIECIEDISIAREIGGN